MWPGFPRRRHHRDGPPYRPRASQVGYLQHPRALMEEGYGPAVRQSDAYSRYVKDRGLPSLLTEANFPYAGCYKATRALLETEPDMTAVVSPSGDGVSGIIEAARYSGRRVPEDFSVVSSSCAERAAMSILPALTSVNMEANLMGSHASPDADPAPEGPLLRPRADPSAACVCRAQQHRAGPRLTSGLRPPRRPVPRKTLDNPAAAI